MGCAPEAAGEISRLEFLRWVEAGHGGVQGSGRGGVNGGGPGWGGASVPTPAPGQGLSLLSCPAGAPAGSRAAQSQDQVRDAGRQAQRQSRWVMSLRSHSTSSQVQDSGWPLRCLSLPAASPLRHSALENPSFLLLPPDPGVPKMP